MTEKRFTIEKKGGMFYVFDTGNLIPVSDGQPICDLLNELHEKNQLVKDTLNELQSIDGFWDSALLQGYISKIANIFGVDLE